MPSSSKSPTDPSFLAGKIVVENIPRRPIAHNDVQKWLGKYGNISEISIYKERILVQFASDLEAAGVVQCENGANFFGTHVIVKHAELGTLTTLRRSGPPVDRFRRGMSSTVDGERDTSRERERERNRDRLRERDREYPRERVPSSMQDRRERDRDDDRRRYRDGQSPRRRSRSPNVARSDRRHVHPLNWLSEVAGNEKKGEGNHPNQPPPPYTVAIVAVQHDLVPYAETIEKRITLSLRTPEAMLGAAPPVRTHIVVLLSLDHLTPCLNDLTRDRVPFAIICTTTNWSHGSCTLRILYGPTQQEHRNMPLDDAMSLLQREYEMYLPSVLTVYSPTVPAFNNAISNASAGTPAQQPPDVRPEAVVPSVPDSHDDEEVDTFMPPSRHVSALLRMLADSRVLSIGELDDIAAFVAERKRRLEGRKRVGTEADTKDLKLRILNMLYPQSSGGPTNSSEPVAVGSSSGQPMPQHPHQQQQQHLTGYSGFLTAPLLSSNKPAMPPPNMPPPMLMPQTLQSPSSMPAAVGSSGNLSGMNSIPTANKLAENLSNPAVRHALDTLMNLPTSSLTQMSTGTTTSVVKGAGMTQPGGSLPQGVAPPTSTMSNKSGGYAGVKHGGGMGPGRGTVYGNGLSAATSRYPGGASSGSGHFETTSPSQQRGAPPASKAHQGDGYSSRESDSGSAVGSGSNRYYGFKQPLPPTRNPSVGGTTGTGPQAGGGIVVDGYRQREMNIDEDSQPSIVSNSAGRGAGSGWPSKRKRGKRGAILGARPVTSGYPGQSSQRIPSYTGPLYKTNQPRTDSTSSSTGPSAGLTDLMSAEVTPVGSVAEAYRADSIGGFLPPYINPAYFHSGASNSYPMSGERFY